MEAGVNIRMRISRRRFLSAVVPMLAIQIAFTEPSTASMRRTSLFGSICMFATELSGSTALQARGEFAERVSAVIRNKLIAIDPGTKRRVAAAPNCLRINEPGFDRELKLMLSIKRQTVKLGGDDWNVVVASGVSLDGLYQDREVQPTILIKQNTISDDMVVDALIEYVDRTIVAELREDAEWLKSGKR
jgi:hypothetical protein